MEWMIYGANGYAAGLVLDLASKDALRPVLAGRREEMIRPVAEKHGLPWQVFGLDDEKELRKGLDGIGLVAHLAGPYSRTSHPMVDACLDRRAHYLDITGEIDVFESILSRGEEAKSAGIALVPGVGFDVVPVDCAAMMLKDELPDAIDLELAFGGFGESLSGVSRGSLKTLLENLGGGARIRVDGVIRNVPFQWKTPTIRFDQGNFKCVTMPWGDVSTAFHSTGIPNIAVYMAAPRGLLLFLRIMRPIVAPPFIHRALQNLAGRYVEGPDAKHRSAASAGVWGRARNSKGEEAELTMSTPEGYTLTADSTVAAIKRVLAGTVPPGAWTPSQAFGKNFVRDLNGVSISEVKKTYPSRC